MPKTVFDTDSFEQDLAIMMLEALEKSGVISVTSKKQLEEHIWKECQDANTQPA